MRLAEMYGPIKNELNKELEEILAERLAGRSPEVISEISGYLLSVKGKRLRPAMAILSAKATLKRP